VYVVEVCRGCGWNHLVEQYLLGRDGIVGPPSDTAEAVGASAPAGSGGGRSGGRGRTRLRPGAGE
jgi:hypothetical protein